MSFSRLTIENRIALSLIESNGKTARLFFGEQDR